jgi:hypothetical protein
MAMNFRHMTRSHVIQLWFSVVLVAAGAIAALGPPVTMATAAVLVATCLVPPVIIFMLWPSETAATMSETIRNAKVR